MKKERKFRIDFVQEFQEIKENEDGSAVITVAMRPDPKRYEIVERNGERAYRDKYLDIIIPESAIKQMAETMEGQPIFFSPPKERNFQEYLTKSKEDLEQYWEIKYEPAGPDISMGEILQSMIGNDTHIVVIYVDLEGSTKLSNELDDNDYMKLIKIFTMQMSRAIDVCRGFVLKYVGDCVIGIFPADTNYTSMSDNAIQSAILMKHNMDDVINPVFKEKGYPEIGCHIGIDAGYVRIDKMGADNISIANDILGFTMNRAAKIQGLSGHNEIFIGHDLFSLLHVTWQEFCKPIETPDNWFTIKETGEKYPVYRCEAIFDLTPQ